MAALGQIYILRFIGTCTSSHNLNLLGDTNGKKQSLVRFVFKMHVFREPYRYPKKTRTPQKVSVWFTLKGFHSKLRSDP